MTTARLTLLIACVALLPCVSCNSEPLDRIGTTRLPASKHVVTSSGFLFDAVGGGTVFVTDLGVFPAPTANFGKYINAWHSFAAIRDGLLCAWTGLSVVTKFDFTKTSVPYGSTVRNCWSVSDDGSTFAMRTNRTLYVVDLSTSSVEEYDLLTLSHLDSLTLDLNNEISGAIDVSPNGKQIAFTLADPLRSEDNTSMTPLMSTYILDMSKLHSSRLADGNNPVWISDDLVLLADYDEPTGDLWLPSIKLIDVRTGDVQNASADRYPMFGRYGAAYFTAMKYGTHIDIDIHTLVSTDVSQHTIYLSDVISLQNRYNNWGILKLRTP